MEEVKVLFRKSKNPYTGEKEVVAFFPEFPASYGNIVSYMHIGGHSEASMKFYNETKPATPEERKFLLEELKAIYDDCVLVVRQRLYYKDLFYKAWNR